MQLFLIPYWWCAGCPAYVQARQGPRHTAAAGLMQATTLTFVIVAAAIGREAGKLTSTAATALVDWLTNPV